MPSVNGRSPDGPGIPEISRRDFLNGCLIASGGFAAGRFAPLRALAAETGGGACGDIIGFCKRPQGFNVDADFAAVRQHADRDIRAMR